MATPTSISASELKRRLDAEETLQLVDVREAMELDLARLQQPVIHLPLSQSETWIEQISSLIRAPKCWSVISSIFILNHKFLVLFTCTGDTGLGVCYTTQDAGQFCNQFSGAIFGSATAPVVLHVVV